MGANRSASGRAVIAVRVEAIEEVGACGFCSVFPFSIRDSGGKDFWATKRITEYFTLQSFSGRIEL